MNLIERYCIECGVVVVICPPKLPALPNIDFGMKDIRCKECQKKEVVNAARYN